MKASEFQNLFARFVATYNPEQKDEIWRDQSKKVKSFLYDRVMTPTDDIIPDEECDAIIKILDRSGKGNTKESHAVARAMVPQGAWRRMFNEFHSNQKLGKLVLSILEATDRERRGRLIDELYQVNQGKGNNLTGPSGNTISTFLAAFDPVNNLSIVSLKDRLALIQFLELEIPFTWDSVSIGKRIADSNGLILDGMRALGAQGSARTLSRFCYSAEFRDVWKRGDTVKRSDKSIVVSVPVASEEDADEPELSHALPEEDAIRESMQVQALLASIGASMGFRIWLPKADRGRVLKAWTPADGELVDELPLSYDATTMKTIEQIDVLWLRKRSVARAFEVEHTTSVYSGLLRMADLVALQPDVHIKLHIVAPDTKREKVLQEMRRPVFSLLEGRPLSEMCSYLSYDNIKDISKLKHLAHLSDAVLEDYAEFSDE